MAARRGVRGDLSLRRRLCAWGLLACRLGRPHPPMLAGCGPVVPRALRAFPFQVGSFRRPAPIVRDAMPQATFRWSGTGLHSVARIRSPNSCTSLNSLSGEPSATGEYTVTFPSPGVYIYTSTAPGDCQAGMLIVFEVESEGAARLGRSWAREALRCAFRGSWLAC